YSIIPLPLAADSRHSRGALTWPRGPGFLRRNKYWIVSAPLVGFCLVINPAAAADRSEDIISEGYFGVGLTTGFPF
ncbi:hypothetical protein D1AOALGA4SA_9300, partial [Olavius algarvensis Delta 1 endosymbiont]